MWQRAEGRQRQAFSAQPSRSPEPLRQGGPPEATEEGAFSRRRGRRWREPSALARRRSPDRPNDRSPEPLRQGGPPEATEEGAFSRRRGRRWREPSPDWPAAAVPTDRWSETRSHSAKADPWSRRRRGLFPDDVGARAEADPLACRRSPTDRSG